MLFNPTPAIDTTQSSQSHAGRGAPTETGVVVYMSVAVRRPWPAALMAYATLPDSQTGGPEGEALRQINACCCGRRSPMCHDWVASLTLKRRVSA